MNKHNNSLQATCPTCKTNVPYEPGGTAQYFPFCSRRCKLIDLGKWLEEEHRIEGTLNDRMPEGSDNTDGEERNGDLSDISG